MALPNNDIGDEAREVLSTQAHIWNHTFNFISSMSLKCVIQLRIPDIIHSHGRAMTLSDLVNALSINKSRGQDSIYRLMRMLIHAGFFIQEEEGYLLTPSSRLLLKDEPNNLSMIPFIQMILDPIMMDPWHYLSQWIQNGGTSPFATTHGKHIFVFNEAMAGDARLVMSVLIQNGKGVFEGLKSLVDAAGGTRTVAKAIAEAFPQINCTVLDLPHVIEGLEGSKNLSYVGGDMFNSIPSADAVVLKSVLLDWEDEDCIKILKKCKEAISNKENGGKVIIIDMVPIDHNVEKEDDDSKTYETQLFYDMLMMVAVSGKQKREQEWAKLFYDAGFSDYNIIPILGLRCVIEVYP
ncbi:trans-resveratrol di-O-methyltransferase-like [Solanum verrucosum]|uniref:trans-resveratrol di-O-methyltransferase-like n=1 Tax=Solanum verrucosum TaxID=315347 RepID=UPI0020D12E93|nr:trans-resveratrol di-O-methyltransferase-like [Solanum verrucosum]